MYNTLNSIASLVRDDRNDAAVSMIVGLSEFLRRASEDSHRSQVVLLEEVEYLQALTEEKKRPRPRRPSGNCVDMHRFP